MEDKEYRIKKLELYTEQLQINKEILNIQREGLEHNKQISINIELIGKLQKENKQLKDKLDKVRELVLDESKVLDEKAILEIIDKEN